MDNLIPLWKTVGPQVTSFGAGRLAKYLQQRKEKRLEDEAILEKAKALGCPPPPEPEQIIVEKTVVEYRRSTLATLTAIATGMVIGWLMARS